MLCACTAVLFIIIVLAALYKNCVIVSPKWIAATCEQPQTCERCGLTKGNILPHNLSEWIVDKEPICTTLGEKHCVCSACGKTINIKTAATCSVTGERIQTCEKCVYKNTESIPKKEHTFVDDKITTYAHFILKGKKRKNALYAKQPLILLITFQIRKKKI